MERLKCRICGISRYLDISYSILNVSDSNMTMIMTLNTINTFLLAFTNDLLRLRIVLKLETYFAN